MTEARVIPYDPPPTVAQFLGSDAFVRVIVGPVGSGKSSGCVMELLRRAVEQRPGPDKVRRTRFSVARNTYRELRDTTRKTFESWVPKEMCEWREADFTCKMRWSVGDGTIAECEVLFRALDEEEDVKKLLSLELTGAYINEVREIKKSILDALKTRVGRYPSKRDGGPTWSGIWADTNPWHTQHWGHELFKLGLEDHHLFRQPSGRSERAENLENLPEHYYDRLIAGQTAEWVKIYVDGEDSTSVVGSIYGDALTDLGEQKEFEHPNSDVFTAWDLGRNDATAIWFFQIEGREKLRVIDYLEDNLKKLDWYFAAVEAKGYNYVKHWLPHDARARTLASDVSVEDQCRRRWPGQVDIGPNLKVLDGIQAARWLLEKKRIRFHPRCAKGLEALLAYRREYDQESKSYRSTPVHDWSSNGADAFRYLAVVSKVTGLIMQKEAPRLERPVAEPIDQRWTLDELWQDHERGLPGRRRI